MIWTHSIIVHSSYWEHKLWKKIHEKEPKTGQWFTRFLPPKPETQNTVIESIKSFNVNGHNIHSSNAIYVQIKSDKIEMSTRENDKYWIVQSKAINKLPILLIFSLKWLMRLAVGSRQSVHALMKWACYKITGKKNTHTHIQCYEEWKLILLFIQW